MSLSPPFESANAASVATMEPQRKFPPRRSPRLAVLDRHPTAVSPTATASPIAASSNKRSIEEVHGNGSSGGVGGGNHSGDPAAMPEAKTYSVTNSGKRSGQKDIDNNGDVRQQHVTAAATAAGAKSSATRSSKRNSHGPDGESNRASGQHQVTDVAATAAGFDAATTGFKKTSAATSSSQGIDDDRDKDSGSDQHVVVAAQPVVKAPATRSPSAKISPDVDEESNAGSCCQEVLPPGEGGTSLAASFKERSGPQVAVAAPPVASASATSSGERRSSPEIDIGKEGGGHEKIFAAAPAALAPTRGSRQDSRQKDNNGGEVLEAAEAEALATSSRKRSIPDATKGESNSTITTDTTAVSPHMVILRQVQADLGEAVYRCEELLGKMEEDLMMRQPNAMSVASVAQGSPAPVSSPASSPPPSSPSSSLGALGPSRGIALHLMETRPVRGVELRERMFSQSSRTSVFWRSPVSRRQRTGEYRHGIDSPPVGCYASVGMITRAQQQQHRRGGAEGQQVVGYDAYHNRWVPLSRRGLKKLALEQAKARGLCGGGGGGDSDDAAATAAAAPGCYPSKGSRFGIGQSLPVTAVRRAV
ncbi:unnamed protein product [Ectocarpus sp. 4 AP-2014]